MVRFSRVWRVVLRMGHPLGRWSLQMMTQDGGKTAPLQGDHEGCRDSTTKLGGMWHFSLALTAGFMVRTSGDKRRAAHAHRRHHHAPAALGRDQRVAQGL